MKASEVLAGAKLAAIVAVAALVGYVGYKGAKTLADGLGKASDAAGALLGSVADAGKAVISAPVDYLKQISPVDAEPEILDANDARARRTPVPGQKMDSFAMYKNKDGHLAVGWEDRVIGDSDVRW
jgi:hypothetical protein